MSFQDDFEKFKKDRRDSLAEGKKKAKDAWVDTKSAAEKARNNVEAEIDKL